jgi:hypothetical protein
MKKWKKWKIQKGNTEKTQKTGSDKLYSVSFKLAKITLTKINIS